MNAIDQDDDLDYPMPDYIAAWKTYRTVSNEDQVIAGRLAQSIILPGPRSKILDVGPGDGRVLVRLLISLKQTPELLTIVEPNEAFCAETLRAVHYDDFAKAVITLQKKLKDCTDDELAGHDVITCTHTLYFMTSAELERLFSLVRGGATLFIVADHPESIFSRLWKQTAPSFYERVSEHIATIRALDQTQFTFAETVISAALCDPMTLRDPICSLVMSMLCYSDVDSMTDEQFAVVRRMIASATTAGRIACDSLFFEISARRPLMKAVD